jgi:tetratricopeptide (TPR) repeat protein
MLVTLPIVLLLLDYWPLDRLKSRADWKRAVVEKLPMLPVILAIGLVTIHMQQEANAFFPVTLPNRIANAFVSYMRYIGAAFWPANLSIFYPHPGAWPAAVTIASVLGVFAITVVVWLARGRRPYLLVGWFLFLVMLLPVIGLIQVGVQSMADRYMYLPFIGVALAVVWFIADVLKAKQSQAVAALSIVICAMLTWNQANYWRSNEALFTHALDVIGESAYMRNNLAAALWMHGRQAEAIAQRERVVQLSSNSAEAHRALGMDYLAVGRTKESLDQLEQALSIEPENALIYLNLAQYFVTTGNIPNAIETLREGARRVPQSQEIKAALKRWSR